MALILTSEQKVSLSIQPLTAAGNLAVVQNPVWSSSDENVVALQVSADGLSAYALSVNPGDAQVNCLVDSDLSEGVRELASIFDIKVVGAEAVTLGIVAGAVELK